MRPMIRRIKILILIFCCINLAFAQQVDSLDFAKETDSLPSDRQSLKIKKLYVPAGLMLAGVAFGSKGLESLNSEIVEERNEHLLNFTSHLDDFLQFSPIVTAYALDAFGVKSKTDLGNRTAILLKGEVLTLGSVFVMKSLIHENRPDSSNSQSFPSGHTAQAFAAATFLSEEYKGRFPWMPYAAYGVASTVGVFRMVNNKHYISDVLFGAGLGILSMKVAYWTHQYKWNKKERHEQAYQQYIKNEKMIY